MPSVETLSIKANSARRQILSKVDPDDFSWALPIMRAGYGGRGIVYLAVAALSLLSLWRGGRAQGTQSALESLQGGWGTIVVALIAAGMFAYALWRLVDSFYDLEAYGTTPKGLIARAGMLVTGTAHAGIGILAITALGLMRSSGDGVEGVVSTIMEMPAGVWLVGIAGVLTVAAAIYYLHKAAAQTYLDTLQANHVTRHWNWVLRLGVAAQGVVVGIIGGLLIYAAMQADAGEAGGMASVFEWLRSQPFGWFLVVSLCLGLLAFSVFCFVNAVYRIVPKATDGEVRSMAAARDDD